MKTCLHFEIIPRWFSIKCIICVYNFCIVILKWFLKKFIFSIYEFCVVLIDFMRPNYMLYVIKLEISMVFLKYPFIHIRPKNIEVFFQLLKNTPQSNAISCKIEACFIPYAMGYRYSFLCLQKCHGKFFYNNASCWNGSRLLVCHSIIVHLMWDVKLISISFPIVYSCI